MVFVSAKQHLRGKLHTSQERSSSDLQGVFFSLKVWLIWPKQRSRPSKLSKSKEMVDLIEEKKDNIT